MNKAKAFGRIAGLSTVFATLILVVFSGLATTSTVVRAHPDDESAATGCTLATVKGSYGVLASGTYLGVGPATAIGSVKTDGAGNLTYVTTDDINGTVYPVTTLRGTYTVSSDCTGTVTLSSNVTFAAVIVNNAGEIDFISTTPGVVETAVAKRIGQ